MIQISAATVASLRGSSAKMAIDQYFFLGLDYQIVSDVFKILFQSVSGLACFGQVVRKRALSQKEYGRKQKGSISKYFFETKA